MVLYLKEIIVACMLTIFLPDHVRNYISLVKIALAVLYNVFSFWLEQMNKSSVQSPAGPITEENVLLLLWHLQQMVRQLYILVFFSLLG